MTNIDSTSRTIKWLLISLLIGLFILFLIYFKDLLKPFVMALMIWYLIKALTALIGKIKIRGNQLPRWLKGTLSLIIILGFIQVCIDIVATNLGEMVQNYSVYQEKLNLFLSEIGNLLGAENITARVKEQFGQWNLRSYLSSVVSSLSSMIGTVVVVIIYIVFLLLEEVTFSKKIDIIFTDPQQRVRVRRLIDEIFTATNKYITIKTYVSLLTGVLSYIVLLLFGVDYAFLWAFIIFIFNYIPYIGSLVATLLPSVFAIVQFGTFWSFLWVFVCIEIIHVIVGNYIEPKVMGKSLNLSPLIVMIALSFWGYVWDVLGMFLSVPITSVMLILMAQFPATRSFAIMLTEKGDIDNLLIHKNGDAKIAIPADIEKS